MAFLLLLLLGSFLIILAYGPGAILGALAGFLVVLVWWLAHGFPRTAGCFFLLLVTLVALTH